MNFTVMRTQQGLPHDSVYAFTQDTFGYIWIATFGGLTRYDGVHLRNYIHDTRDPHSLPDNNVRVLLPGPNGSLWLGTGNAGIITYEPKDDTFHPLPNFPSVLARAHIFCMAADQYGGIWFGSQLGLAHYNAHTQQYEIFGKVATTHDPTFTLGSVFSVFVDSYDNLWVGGDHGVLIRRAGQSHFEPIKGQDGPHQLGVFSSIWEIFEDREHRIWIGADKTGLGLYNPATHTIDSIPSLTGEDSLIGAATVRGMFEAAPNQFWIATYGSGLILFDANKMQSRRYERDLTSSGPLSNNFIRGLFLDRTGMAWIGTDRGLSLIDCFSDALLNIHASPLRDLGLQGNEVRSVAAQGDRLWVGFDTGGSAVIEPDGTIHNVKPAPGVSVDDQSRREVLAIRATPDGKVYAGGTGLYQIDPGNLTYRPVSDPLLNDQIINALLVDGPDLWVATYAGLVRYNRTTHQARLYSHQVNDPTSLSDNYVRDFIKTSDGRLWITTRLGLDVLDASGEHFTHIRHNAHDPASLPNDNIQPIAEDQQGHIWIGTIGDGITILESKTGKPRFRTLSRANGFPSDIVLTVMLGKDGRIWSNTPSGLAVIDPTTFAIKTYTSADGLQTSSQNLFSSATLPDGTIVFPGDQGLIVVRPSLLDRPVPTAPLVLSELTIAGDTHSPASAAWLATQNGIHLPSSTHSFQSTFALLDYTAPDAVLYSYRLEGFDKRWSTSSKENRTITYTNLPPGHYHLLVRAASRFGSGPAAEVSIPLFVAATWWESWWFGLFEVLAIALLIVLAIRIRTRVSRHRQAVLEEQVAQRTAELAQKQTELVAANQRLSELATLDALTGAMNRREFLAIAENELLRTRRTRRPFTLLLIDVDRFKAVNDTYGHGAGDIALRTLVSALTNQLRRGDHIARYGGEELIVLLSETDLDASRSLAERLRVTAQALTITYENRKLSITISIGVAEANSSEPIDDVIRHADEALYRAKNAGRNRVAYSTPPADESPKS